MLARGAAPRPDEPRGSRPTLEPAPSPVLGSALGHTDYVLTHHRVHGRRTRPCAYSSRAPASAGQRSHTLVIDRRGAWIAREAKAVGESAPPPRPRHGWLATTAPPHDLARRGGSRHAAAQDATLRRPRCARYGARTLTALSQVASSSAIGALTLHDATRVAELRARGAEKRKPPRAREQDGALGPTDGSRGRLSGLVRRARGSAAAPRAGPRAGPRAVREGGEAREGGGGRGRRPHVITCNRWAQDYVTSTWPSAPYYCTNAWDLREMDLLWPARCHGL